jgi:hypothetical protein
VNQTQTLVFTEAVVRTSRRAIFDDGRCACSGIRRRFCCHTTGNTRLQVSRRPATRQLGVGKKVMLMHKAHLGNLRRAEFGGKL